MKFKDYYETLGVAHAASQDDISARTGVLARKYHPDVSKEANAESRFKEVGEAYRGPEGPREAGGLRSIRKDWKHRSGVSAASGMESGGSTSAVVGSPVTPVSASSSRRCSGHGGIHGARGPMRAKGGDRSVRIEIPIEDAYRGAMRNITLQGRTLSVRIPKGVTEGQRIRLGGQGGVGPGGGPAGDLYLTVTHAAHPLFRADGQRRTPQASRRTLGGRPRGDGRGADARGQGRLEDSPQLSGRSDPAAERARASRPAERRSVRCRWRSSCRLPTPPEAESLYRKMAGVDGLRSEGRLSGVMPSTRWGVARLESAGLDSSPRLPHCAGHPWPGIFDPVHGITTEVAASPAHVTTWGHKAISRPFPTARAFDCGGSSDVVAPWREWLPRLQQFPPTPRGTISRRDFGRRGRPVTAILRAVFGLGGNSCRGCSNSR